MHENDKNEMGSRAMNSGWLKNTLLTVAFLVFGPALAADEPGEPLLSAVISGDIDTVSGLLDKGADPGVRG